MAGKGSARKDNFKKFNNAPYWQEPCPCCKQRGYHKMSCETRKHPCITCHKEMFCTEKCEQALEKKHEGN